MKKTTTVTTYCAADPAGRPCSIEYLDRTEAEGAAFALGLKHVRETRTNIIETTAKIGKK